MTIRDLLIRVLPTQYIYVGETKMINGRMIDEMVTRGRGKEFLERLYDSEMKEILYRKIWLIQSIDDSLHVHLMEEVSNEKETKEEA